MIRGLRTGNPQRGRPPCAARELTDGGGRTDIGSSETVVVGNLVGSYNDILIPQEHALIFITAKFPVKAEYADEWPRLSQEFTEATRGEEGCLWFEWPRSLEDPTVYVLVEAFRDGDAGGAHVSSDHFVKATAQLPGYLARTPDIVSVPVDGTAWSELGEMAVH